MANVAWLVNAVAGAPAYSGRMVRQAMSVALGGATAARPLGARSGVRPGTPASTVALPTATSYVIHPHAGVLDTQASALAGPYWYVVGSDGADETGTVNAAHGTWPRKDILWVRVDDPAEEGTNPPLVVTGYTVGTAAASPAPPATPARCMRLATISVPLSGGGSPTIVWDAPDLDTGPRGWLASSTNPATQTDYSSSAVVVSVTVSCVAGRKYLVMGEFEGIQQTSSGVPNVRLAGSAGVPTKYLYFQVTTAGTFVYGSTTAIYEPTTTASRSFQVTASDSTGALRIAALGASIIVTDIGAA